MPDVTNILRELVAIDSRSSLTNEPIVCAIERTLGSCGFILTRHNYRDASGVQKINLVALSQATDTPALALCAHTDTVPFDPAWKDALVLSAQDGKLVGRGSCDTKGFGAAALAAALRFDPKRLRKPLALIFTADEEVGCVGAKQLVQTQFGARAGAPSLHPRHAIVGEPTGLTPIRAHKGYVLAEVSIAGRQGHSAHPALGASAILAAGDLLGHLEALDRDLRTHLNPAFEPAYATFNVGTIHGGEADNVIPGHCRFGIEWRPLPGQSPAGFLAAVEQAARDVSAARGVSITVAAPRQDTGFEASESGRLVQFLATRSGNAPATASYFTEAPCLAALGAETVVFGPGDIRHAHQTNEFVPEAELRRCEAILADAIEHFCL